MIKLKSLQTERSLLEKDLEVLLSRKKDLQHQISAKEKKIKTLDNAIDLASKSEIVISEHAILRLLQRRYFQEEIIEKVISEIKDELKGVPRNCQVPINGELRAIIKNNVLITVK